MGFHASVVLLAATSLGRTSAKKTPSSVSRKLQQNFNYEEITELTKLSTTSKTQSVNFTATFTNLWTKSRHPFNYPSGSAHWSPMVFASHSEEYTMWCDGCTADDGIELIAETGAPTVLELDLDKKKNVNVVLD